MFCLHLGLGHLLFMLKQLWSRNPPKGYVVWPVEHATCSLGASHCQLCVSLENLQ